MENTADKVLRALEAYDLKKQGNEWRCNSPFRPGSNSHAFALTIHDGEHGAWIDHARDDQKGSLYELAALLNIETPKRQEVASTKRAYAGIADYARAHGVEPFVFLEAAWAETTHNGRPALAFSTANGTRYRYLDGNGSYTNNPGYKACWYGLSRAIERAKEINTPLILCNGEATTVVAQSYGFAACAVTNGEKKYPEYLLTELTTKWDGGFIIALDCDDTGRKVAQEIAAQLVGRPVAVMDLGLTDGGDLADFCALHTDDSWGKFWKLAPKPTVASQAEVIQKVAATELAAAIQELKGQIARSEASKQAEDLTQQIAKARALLDQLESQSAKPKLHTFEVVADKALEQLDAMFASPNKLLGLSWGFAGLNRVTRGLQPATINVLYGATSMGKTTMTASIIRELLGQGGGLIIPTETLPYRYLFRIAGTLCKIPFDRIAAGDLTNEEYQKARNMIVALRARGWQFLEHPQPTPSQLRSAVLDAAYAGAKVVVIDSASRLASAGDYNQTAIMHNLIQALAIETGLPFLVTSQVGRDVSEREKSKLPRLTDAYGGGVIENNADFVLGMYRHQYYVDQKLADPSHEYPENTAAGIVLKNRNGGSLGAFMKFAYVGGAGFYELAEPKPQQ